MEDIRKKISETAVETSWEDDEGHQKYKNKEPDGAYDELHGKPRVDKTDDMNRRAHFTTDADNKKYKYSEAVTDKKSKHVVNGIAKFLRTPGSFPMQVISDKKKKAQKLACRKPVEEAIRYSKPGMSIAAMAHHKDTSHNKSDGEKWTPPKHKGPGLTPAQVKKYLEPTYGKKVSKTEEVDEDFSLGHEHIHDIGTKVIVNKPEDRNHGQRGKVIAHTVEPDVLDKTKHVLWHKVKTKNGETNSFFGHRLQKECMEAYDETEISPATKTDKVNLTPPKNRNIPAGGNPKSMVSIVKKLKKESSKKEAWADDTEDSIKRKVNTETWDDKQDWKRPELEDIDGDDIGKNYVGEDHTEASHINDFKDEGEDEHHYVALCNGKQHIIVAKTAEEAHQKAMIHYKVDANSKIEVHLVGKTHVYGETMDEAKKSKEQIRHPFPSAKTMQAAADADKNSIKRILKKMKIKEKYAGPAPQTHQLAFTTGKNNVVRPPEDKKTAALRKANKAVFKKMKKEDANIPYGDDHYVFENKPRRQKLKIKEDINGKITDRERASNQAVKASQTKAKQIQTKNKVGAAQKRKLTRKLGQKRSDGMKNKED